MSTLRISNIEAKSVPASATVDEKVKITNSSGDTLVFIDGKTSGITTIGINTTDGNIKFDANSNVVVTGIITATRFSGQITPTSLEIGSNIKLGNAGVITATSFVGSGANLTNLPAQVNINGNADNRVITGGSGVNLNAESNVLYDGTNFGIGKSPSRTLDVQGKIRSSDSVCFGDNSSTPSEGAAIHRPAASTLAFVTNNAERLRIASDGQLTHNYDIGSNGDAGVILNTDDATKASSILFRANNENRARIDVQRLAGDGAQLKIQVSQMNNSNTMLDAMTIAPVTSGDTTPDVTLAGNLKFASGGGIDFSATADGASGSYLNSEVLADYERGRFEPRFLENGNTDSNYAWRYGQYVKIGNMCHVHMAFGIASLSGNFTTAFIGGLPFSMSSQWGTNDFSYVQLVGYSYASGYGDSGNTTQLSMELNQTHGTMHRVVQGQGKSNVNQSCIGSNQRFAFQFSYPVS